MQAIPDVAAQGVNFQIFWDGSPYLVAGTSASTPSFSGIVSLLNDARIANSLSPLGFLNPLVYALGTISSPAFNDITVGNAPGCGTQGFNVSLVSPSLQYFDIKCGAGVSGMGSCDRMGKSEFRCSEGYCTWQYISAMERLGRPMCIVGA